MSKFRWFPAITIMLFVSMLSSIPGKTLTDAGLGSEPLHISGHSIMFFLLCFVYFKGYKDIIVAVLLTAIFGVVDELHQMLTPLRSASFFDIYTDSIGALLAGLILWKLQYILPKKLKDWLNK